MDNKWKATICALLALCLFFPSFVYAKKHKQNGGQCSVHGNKDFVVQIRVTGSNDYQELYFTQGQKREQTLWYTQNYNPNPDYIFNEPNLNVGQTYEIRIEHDSSSSEYNLYYYRRELRQTEWVLLAKEYRYIKEGNLTGQGTDIRFVSCSEETVTPPEPPVFPEQCAIAPYAVQSWQGAASSALTFTGDGNIYGTKSLQGKVGFDQVVKEWDEQKACDGLACEADTGLIVASPAIESVSTTTQSVTLGWNSTPESFTGNNYRKVTVSGGVHIFPNSEYQIGELVVLNDAIVRFPNKTWLKVNKLTMIDNGQFVTKDNDSANLIIWAENASSGASAYIDIGEGTKPIHAFIFSRHSVRLSGSSSIIGSITSRYIEMDGSSRIDARGNGCSTPVEISRIEIKPYNYHLTCEIGDDQIVEVHVFNSEGNYVSGYRPLLGQVNGNNLTISFISEANGIAQYRVTTTPTSTIGDYDLKASLTTGGRTFEDTEQIKYVPYKFEVADQYVIAGQNNQASVDVKACSNSGQLITLGYTGSPTASFTYQRPSSALVDANDFIFSAQLTDSNRNADFTFKESGHIRVTMTDNSFVCDDGRCPVEGGTLKGQFDVYSRPWKIAICNVAEVSNSSNLNPATTTGTPGFMPSGDDFTVSYIPIVHGDSKGSASDQCDYPQTGNYGLDNGPLNVTYRVIYPTPSAVSGTVTPSTIPAFDSSNLTRQLTHNWNEVGTVQFTTGATYLTMDLDTDQVGIGRFYPKFFGVVNTPVWNYPDTQTFAYMNQPFNGVTFDVEALNSQGQPVQNYAGFDFALTANFVLFEPDFTERFNSPTPNKSWVLSSQGSIGTFTLDRANPSTDCESELCWEKAPSAEGYQDGPFNGSSATVSNISITDVGLTNADPVDYQAPVAEEDSPRVLTLQPDIRFGRMALDSVGGTTNSALAIPLRVEFWNGSRFITNQDDSSTNVVGSNVISDNRNLWVETGATAADVSLNDSGQVSSGQTRTIEATRDSNVRQQTQLWLELDNASNQLPWLRYRWQDANRAEINGEEDPSSVVTFGIYRGNDRVIFRGEPGLTGQ
ncbi:MSHA biogenesis protein MshQ [Vibrio sinaloensis]|nr:MSHA biogenesis protein MshQ [Vibrio sinaloensis]